MVDWPNTQSGAWNSDRRSTRAVGPALRRPAARDPGGRAATIRSGRRRTAGSRPGTSAAGRPRRRRPPATRCRRIRGRRCRRLVADGRDPHLGAVPGHGRVVPGHPGQPAAVGRRARGGHEVAARSTRGTTGWDPSTGTRHQPVAGRGGVPPAPRSRPATGPTGSAGRRHSGCVVPTGAGDSGGEGDRGRLRLRCRPGTTAGRPGRRRTGRRPATVAAPPPYSWTRLRTLTPAGDTSTGAVAGRRPAPPPGGPRRRDGSPTSRPIAVGLQPTAADLAGGHHRGRPRRRPPAEGRFPAGSLRRPPGASGPARARSSNLYGTGNDHCPPPSGPPSRRPSARPASLPTLLRLRGHPERRHASTPGCGPLSPTTCPRAT